MIAPQEMQQRLTQVFNERQADVLADVIRSAYSDLVRTISFNSLKSLVRELATAQQRTEQRMEDGGPADLVYIALEASMTVNKDDVARVSERAALLRRCGLQVVPVVAGERFARAVTADALASAVAILRNGGGQGWDEALAAA